MFQLFFAAALAALVKDVSRAGRNQHNGDDQDDFQALAEIGFHVRTNLPCKQVADGVSSQLPYSSWNRATAQS